MNSITLKTKYIKLANKALRMKNIDEYNSFRKTWVTSEPGIKSNRYNIQTDINGFNNTIKFIKDNYELCESINAYIRYKRLCITLRIYRRKEKYIFVVGWPGEDFTPGSTIAQCDNFDNAVNIIKENIRYEQSI